MEITRKTAGETLELRLQGRLDAHWSDFVGNAIAEAIRGGHHRIELHLAAVDYLSSAGLRTLLTAYKQLKAVKGSLAVTQPSEGAHKILRLAGVAELLVATPTPVAAPSTSSTPRRVEHDDTVFDVFEQAPGAVLHAKLAGRPGKLASEAFTASDSLRMAFPDGTLGLGLGAFGTDFEDCRGRFGEFLAAAGAAATLPTDGSDVPDWVLTEGALVPELQVLYGVTARGRFARMIRFDVKAEPRGSLGLGRLVERALEINGTPDAAVVILAEAAGIVGAALRQSPGKDPAPERLGFPQARDWIQFNTERTTGRSLMLAVGVASTQPSAGLLPFVRPMGFGSPVHGHFHAAIFPYRPVQRGSLDLTTAVSELLSLESAQGLLHLLADDRPFEGSGQTEVMRGACWIGPIAAIEAPAA